MDLLRLHADDFIALGKLLGEHCVNLYAASITPDSPITINERTELMAVLKQAWVHCVRLDLPVSESLLAKAQDNPPHSHEALQILIDLIKEEIKSKLFLYIPSHRIKYYDWQLAEKIKDSFPDASGELTRAGRCYSKGENTACVFHSMRAAEIGLRSLARYLGVTFPYSIDLAEWKNILDKIDASIKSKQNLPKSSEKGDGLKFCSEAAAQFRYFKDAYRIFVAHARESYDEEQALSIMQRTGEFIVSVSSKLKEMAVSS